MQLLQLLPVFILMDAASSITADAVTELQVSNSRLAEVEAAFAAQKSEVRFFIVRVESWILD